MLGKAKSLTWEQTKRRDLLLWRNGAENDSAFHNPTHILVLLPKKKSIERIGEKSSVCIPSASSQIQFPATNKEHFIGSVCSIDSRRSILFTLDLSMSTWLRRFCLVSQPHQIIWLLFRFGTSFNVRILAETRSWRIKSKTSCHGSKTPLQNVGIDLVVDPLTLTLPLTRSPNPRQNCKCTT